MAPEVEPAARRVGLTGCAVLLSLVITACTTTPPADRDDICAIFDEKRSWYRQARKSERRWGTSIPVMMSIVHQESGFRARAKPPRRKILWVIPGPRPASAKGYSQATNESWTNYQKATGRWTADRNDFADAIDFVGWYNDQSQRRNGIGKSDAYNLYLAYHEGHGGFSRRSYRNKEWLQNAARTVAQRAATYESQWDGCKKRFTRGFFGRLLPF